MQAAAEVIIQMNDRYVEAETLNGAHIYLRNVNLMNDIINLQDETHTGSGSVCIHLWCSRGLFIQKDFTALLPAQPGSFTPLTFLVHAPSSILDHIWSF